MRRFTVIHFFKNSFQKMKKRRIVRKLWRFGRFSILERSMYFVFFLQENMTRTREPHTLLRFKKGIAGPAISHGQADFFISLKKKLL